MKIFLKVVGLLIIFFTIFGPQDTYRIPYGVAEKEVDMPVWYGEIFRFFIPGVQTNQEMREELDSYWQSNPERKKIHDDFMEMIRK